MVPSSHSMLIASSFFRKKFSQKTMSEGMTNFSLSNSDGKNMDKFLLQDNFQNYCPYSLPLTITSNLYFYPLLSKFSFCCYFCPFSRISHQCTLFPLEYALWLGYWVFQTISFLFSNVETCNSFSSVVLNWSFMFWLLHFFH